MLHAGIAASQVLPRPAVHLGGFAGPCLVCPWCCMLLTGRGLSVWAFNAARVMSETDLCCVACVPHKQLCRALLPRQNWLGCACYQTFVCLQPTTGPARSSSLEHMRGQFVVQIIKAASDQGLAGAACFSLLSTAAAGAAMLARRPLTLLAPCTDWAEGCRTGGCSTKRIAVWCNNNTWWLGGH
jgi:hypothetical protein